MERATKIGRDHEFAGPIVVRCADQEISTPVVVCSLRMVPVCAACESGIGGECHTPGCSFWMRDAPSESLAFHDVDLG
jgi:myo-inositol-1-phosphate synthase